MSTTPEFSFLKLTSNFEPSNKCGGALQCNFVCATHVHPLLSSSPSYFEEKTHLDLFDDRASFLPPYSLSTCALHCIDCSPHSLFTSRLFITFHLSSSLFSCFLYSILSFISFYYFLHIPVPCLLPQQSPFPFSRHSSNVLQHIGKISGLTLTALQGRSRSGSV